MIITALFVLILVGAAITAGCTSKDGKEKIEDKIDDVFGDKIKKWDECKKSSNWTGKNAAKRMMNMLSPNMPDSVFNERLNFIKSRGCDHANVFVCNKGDGEYAGYSIYGNSITWIINKNFCSVMEKRIKKLKDSGLGIVLWLAADDDGGWNKELAKHFAEYSKDIKSLGWFKYASAVVIGLECDEYWNANQVVANIAALRKEYSGKIGVHMTSGKWDWVKAADILFYQTNPGKSAAQIESETKTVVAKCGGKPVCFFEMERNENRDLCEAAFRGGAYSVGNW